MSGKKNHIFFVILLTLISCGEAKKGLEKEFMPTARGDIGEIILVMDSSQYEGKLGDQVKSVFREPMRGLPQDEPMFSLGKASPKRLNNILRSAANMIFVMTLDSKTSESNVLRGFFTNQSLKTIQRDTSIFMSIRKDEFARGQLVLYLYSTDEELLIKKLEENRDQLQALFESAERERLKDRVFSERAKDIEAVIAEDHPFTINVPFGWDLAKNSRNFVWIRQLQADKERNFFVYYEPYTDAEIFENVPQFRDRVTETNLRDSEKPEIYITRQQRDDIKAVFTNTVSFNGSYAVKARGLWKISDNSGGGPYVSYTIVDEDQQMIYYIEGYVYSPGTDKGNYIRELDTILSTFKTDNKTEPTT